MLEMRPKALDSYYQIDSLGGKERGVSVTKLRVTRTRLLAAIRDASKNSSNVIFIPPPDKKSMAGMMNFRQALLCLQRGELVGQPKLNAHGHWESTIVRHAAGVEFRAKVIAECDGARVSRIFLIWNVD